MRPFVVGVVAALALHPSVASEGRAVAGAAAGPAPVSIRVAPTGWSGGEPATINLVLNAVAEELLFRFPGRPPLAPILVSHSNRSPVTLYERGPAGEYRIELTARGKSPAPYIYEFAHEFCHVLANFDRHRHDLANRSQQWFEEALCEAASLYTLKALSSRWQTSAPKPELAAAAPGLARIARRFQQESHRRLPSGMTLAAWYRESMVGLSSSAYDRDRNEVVANLLLPLFEENPELWGAIGFLNHDAPGASFQQYLQAWLDNAPPRYKDVIRYTISLFFQRASNASTTVGDYPRHPLEIIVTFGPGGGADGMARKLGELLEPLLGVPVLVHNVPGASGNAGLTKLLLSADPDHTLVTLIALTAAAWADGVGNIGPADFTVLGVVQDSPSMLFVAADSPLLSFQELLSFAQAWPLRLQVATSGRGTLDDLTLALLADAGYRMINTPFANPQDRYAAVLDRRSDVLFEEPGDVADFLASGKLRALVTFADQRHPEFPAVPAISEFGLSIGDLPNFRALAVNASVSSDKVDLLVKALDSALASDEWKRYCAETYSCTALSTPAQAKTRVQAMVDRVAGYRERLSR